MSDEKIAECFFEPSPCLWQENPNCKACARGRDYLHPQTCCPPEWLVKSGYHCLKALPMESFIIEVEAENEDDAYNKASAAMVDVEPDMEIVP